MSKHQKFTQEETCFLFVAVSGMMLQHHGGWRVTQGVRAGQRGS